MPDWVGGYASGPVVRIRPKYRDRGDVGIHRHELEHVRQWYAGLMVGMALALALQFIPELARLATYWTLAIPFGISIHSLLYLLLPQYRMWAEVAAYRKQLASYPHGTDCTWAAQALATKYRLRISIDDARRALSIDGSGHFQGEQ
ncbi:MAG: hypothetical protein ACT4NV_15745 [Rhodoferax sp.]